MKKVLIWDNFELKNNGGPSGYLYNIHEYLKVNPSSQIVFLSDLLSKYNSKKDIIVNKQSNNHSSIEQTNKNIEKKHILSRIFHKLRELKRHAFYYFNCQKKNVYDFCVNQFEAGIQRLPQNININEYDFVHIHFVTQVISFRLVYPDYTGKLILTSHCPCPYIDEILTSMDSWFRLFRLRALKKECQAYQQADYLLFPCKGAREPYEKENRIKKIFRSNENKFIYVPTSILDLKNNTENIQKISTFGIPDSAFVIGYFGRHNIIKGYDILKQLGKELLEKYPNLYFVCAGAGEIKPLAHNRWIELGFISNTQELLPQCDLYILPNRETYFDIITLEVLRAGIKIVISNTGGNKYFRELPKEETTDILYFEINKVKSLRKIVEQIIDEKQHNKHKPTPSKNTLLFRKYFTPEHYVKNYIDYIERL